MTPSVEVDSEDPSFAGAGSARRLGQLVGRRVFQRIGWLRPSQHERRLWWIEGALISALVLVIGLLMLVALR